MNCFATDCDQSLLAKTIIGVIFIFQKRNTPSTTQVSTRKLYSVSKKRKEEKKPRFNFKSLKNEKKNHQTNIRE